MIEVIALVLVTLFLAPMSTSVQNDQQAKQRGDVAACVREVQKRFPGFDAYVGRDGTIHMLQNEASSFAFEKCMDQRGTPLH
jgi:hypothetical protein